ncbi:AIPR family protein [Sphingomonas sp. MG17]|uniref:AIPR family protein n=1 Tax=Sphingomonas tagetis TaxID=2949092 RepID=A0A9X2HKY7_9SPHN|nr:AIPR family protein [Sphingomonas tagetis]MCP3733111.1 AIPR family protein [Sphingomonas tagetis]
MDDPIEFHRELLAEVRSDADAQGLITSEAFLEKMGEILDEAGELSSFTQCYHDGAFKRKPVQVDAFAWDFEDEEGSLSLVISDFHRESEPVTIGKTEANRLLSRLVQFVMASLDREYREGLEESSEAYALADLIRRCWKKIGKIKLILVTNAINKAKTDAQPVGKIGDVPVTSNVWDLGRIQRFVEAGQTREDLVIDFAEDFGEAIPVLRASDGGGPLESYIAVIPGGQLAQIYDRWGARLLEANVRSFLQARGKVNRGIRDTIVKDPAMFFSYNNGLTTTAESVEVASIGEGLFLMSAANFQIVNGGQTTASIHAVRKLAAEQLKDVYVQMKLTVVPPDRSETVVPSISQFANSQNKVNAADFFANHPFHIRMEEYSRRILAPIGDTGYREHKWFYERARGQFADERGRRSVAERKSFDAMFPKNQFFTKTDLAKFENSWRCKPHIVSFGAQKNFAELAKVIGQEWGDNDGPQFDELWFQRLIAKAIIFRNLERIVPAQLWYTGGYRANIVTYAIAKAVHDAAARDRSIDLDQTWRMQRVHVELERALLVAAEAANDVITNPPQGVRNMSEWAKKQACWAELAKRPVAYQSGFDAVLIDPDSLRAVSRDNRTARRQLNGIEAQREVVNQGGDYWSQLLAFGKSIGKLAPKEAGILQACTLLPNRVPSEKQCVAAVAIADRLEQYYDNAN